MFTSYHGNGIKIWIVTLNFYARNENTVMALDSELKEYITEADNIYDLVGNCFGALCDHINNHPMFISCYLDKEDGIPCNPNIERLNDFSEMIMKEVNEYKASKYLTFRNKIVKEADELELDNYKENKYNQLTIIYSILSAIDAGIMSWNCKWRLRGLGPLDSQQKTSYRVYINMKRNIHDDYIIGIDRTRALSSTLFEQFQSFRFVDTKSWRKTAAVPVIKFFPLPRKLYKVFLNSRRLKMAVVPVSCKMNFKKENISGSGFRIKYSENEQRLVSNKVCHAIESAVGKGSNIIILPEYVVSPYIYDSIRNYLKERYKRLKSTGKLLLVFAGTTWTDDDNNVMHILNARGDLIGEYYKYSPFTERKKGKPGYKMCEALSSPGKVCEAIAVENIGVFLPAICRDVIDCEYTEQLARYLLPLFVMVAAWSRSVASFEGREKELANKYFSSTVLANGCSAVRSDAPKIGNAGIIHQLSTIAGNKIQNISRNMCYAKNKECKGCYNLLDYDFMFIKDKKNTELNISRYDLD